MRAALLLLVFVACACAGDDVSKDAGTLTCEQAADRFFAAVNEEAGTPSACSTTADCTLYVPMLNCERGAYVSGCPIALHVARVDPLEQALAERHQELCESTPHCGLAACPALTATCSAGRCATQMP
jgi:hypothetical protein